MIEEIRNKAEEFLVGRRKPLTTYIVVFMLLISLLTSLLGENFVSEFLNEVLSFLIISSVQLVILDAYRSDSKVEFSIFTANVKQHGAKILVLGIFIQLITFVIVRMIRLMLFPFMAIISSDFMFLYTVLLSLISAVVITVVTYFFIFSIFYIKDRNMKPLAALKESYQDSMGKKMEMFKIEFKYHAISVTSILLTLLLALMTYSEGILIIGLIVSLIVIFYYLVNTLAVRTMYYVEVSQIEKDISFE